METTLSYAVDSYVTALEEKIIELKKELKTPKEIKWFSNSGAKIPSKRSSDSGYDVYSIRNNIWLKPHETKMFATGLSVILPPGIWLWATDRGSTGSKGIHTHCGIIDEGYTGEIFIALCNTNKYPILFTNEVDSFCFKRTWYGRKYACYPTSKGIAQLIPVYRPNMVESVATQEEFEMYRNLSERKDGKLGASGK